MKQKIIRIIRLLIELAIIYGVYTETGIFTACFALLITLLIEMRSYHDTAFNKSYKQFVFKFEEFVYMAKKKIDEMDKNIKSLKNSDKELEKVAREKFLMKKKNEKAFKFEDKKDTLR